MIQLHSLRSGLSKLFLVATAASLLSTQDARAVSLPVVDGSLKLWLDAGSITGLNNGDPVATWNDLSGSGNGAIQTTSGSQPLYIAGGLDGQPVVRFDAADDGMATGLTVSSGPYTVFAVFNYHSTSSANRRAIQGSENWLIGPYELGVRHHTAAGGWVTSPGPRAGQNQFYLAEALNTGGASTFLVDGANFTNNAASIGSPGVVHLGGSGLYPGEVLDGDIAEVIVYNRALTASEQTAVTGYLKSKYSLGNVFNLAYGRPVIDGSSAYNGAPFNSGDYPASRVTDGIASDTITNGSSYWLGTDGDPTEYVTVDLGSSQSIGSITLRNTHNQVANDRGTRTFEIWASNSVDGGNHLVDPVRILQGTLTTSRGPNDDAMVPLDTFNAYNGLSSGTYRYLRVNTLSSSFNGNHVGLNEIQVFAESLSANVAAGKPVTTSGSLAEYADFVAENVVDQRIDDFRSGYNWDHDRNGVRASYWLGREQTANEWITIDLGEVMAITGIDLQNTHNTTFDDRGTKDFRIEASSDGSNFTTVIAGTLADVAGTGDNIPIESFSVRNGDFSLFSARYIRFEATNYYGNGAGLNEIFVFAHVPEPGSIVLAAMGLLGLAGYGRRSRGRPGRPESKPLL
jgi:hypothetical protein